MKISVHYYFMFEIILKLGKVIFICLTNDTFILSFIIYFYDYILLESYSFHKV